MSNLSHKNNEIKYVTFKTDQRQIYFEFGYLIVTLALASTSLLLLYILPLSELNITTKKYFYSIIGAFIGGWCFNAKWFYRVTARGKNNQYIGWHANKFYWRIITPVLSTLVGFTFYIIVIAKIIPFVVIDPISNTTAFGFSFIFGYFSDIAIGKISDWLTNLIQAEKSSPQFTENNSASRSDATESIIGKIENCSICEELSFKTTNIDTPYTELIKNKKNILAASDNFSVISSIGALNDHHLMIVTNNHYTSISKALTKFDNELISHISSIKDFNKTKFNLGTFFFEHGSCFATKNDTSCIEHAHLHCLGTNLELLTAIKEQITLEEIPKDDLKIIKTSYLLYIDLEGNWWINRGDSFASQLIRKIYCQKEGREDWNWRDHPKYDTILMTIENYKDLQQS